MDPRDEVDVRHPVSGADGLHRAVRPAVVVLLLVASLVLFVLRFDAFQVGTYVDDAHYIVLAESLLREEGYGLVSDPEGPAPTRYPFGWPMLLAPALALVGGDVTWLRFVALAFTMADIGLLAFGWRLLGLPSAGLGLACAALYGLSVTAITHARTVMSEPAFLFFVLLALLATRRLDAAGLRHPRLVAFGLGVALLWAASVRTVGWTVVAGCLVYLLLRRRRAAAGWAVAGACLSAALAVALTPVASTDVVNVVGYVEQLRHPEVWERPVVAGPARLVGGLVEYATTHARDALLPLPHNVGLPVVGPVVAWLWRAEVPAIVGVTLSALIVLGYAVTWRRGGLHPGHLVVPPMLVVLAVWAWRADRFLYGIVPLLGGWFLVGGATVLQAARCRLPSAGADRIVAAVGGAALAMVLGVHVAANVMFPDSSVYSRDLRVGATWIRDHAPSDAVVYAEEPQVAYLYAERPTAPLARFDPAAEPALAAPGPPVAARYLFLAPIHEWRVDHRWRLSSHTEELLAVLDAAPDRFERVFADEPTRVRVYRVR